jgi:hypothetical protein
MNKVFYSKHIAQMSSLKIRVLADQYLSMVWVSRYAAINSVQGVRGPYGRYSVGYDLYLVKNRRIYSSLAK